MKGKTWKIIILFVGFLFSLLVFNSCSPQAAAPAPTVTPIPEKPSVTTPAAPSKPAWQQEWENLVNAAKKEGRVVIGIQLGAEVRQALAQTFKEKYGIDLEFIVGRAAENVPKLRAERQAGLYLMDVYIDGISSQLQLKEAGFLESIEPALFLPEVVDSKVWIGGGINFIGKDKYALTFASRPTITVAVNTEMVKPGEIKSYRDLLHPQWKGKIVMQDPTVSGAGNLVMTVLTWDIMGQDFLDELARQEPMIIRNNRVQIEWVARAKYPVTIAPDSSILAEFIKSGAPLKPVWPIEGTALSAGFGGLGLINKAAHPAAAKVFVNWLLTKEGQTTITRAWGSQSARLDVIADWVEPEWRVQPGYKYVQADTEESAFRRMKTMETAKEKLGHLLK